MKAIPEDITPNQIEVRLVEGGWLVYVRFEWETGEADQYGRREEHQAVETHVAETAERMAEVVLEQSGRFRL